MRRRAYPECVHDCCVARLGADAGDLRPAYQGVYKGRFAHVGGAEDDDFRNVLVEWMVAQRGGRVEKVRACFKEGRRCGEAGLSLLGYLRGKLRVGIADGCVGVWTL